MTTFTNSREMENTSMMHPAVFDGALGLWYVLHTKSRQEKALAASLFAMDVPFVLPMVRKACYHGRRKVFVNAPLFPGYLFLRGSIDQAYEADRTKRLANVIQVADQARIDREIHSLHLAIGQEARLDPYPYLKKGIWVEVRSGPFEGMQGLIEDRVKADRLILQVDVLGQATSVEIDSALLETIE